MAERRRVFLERRTQLEQRKRKIHAEQAELGQRQSETTQEYEVEKKEIYNDIDDKETTAGALEREIRNKTIDVDLDCKKVVADEERVIDATRREKQELVERK